MYKNIYSYKLFFYQSNLYNRKINLVLWLSYNYFGSLYPSITLLLPGECIVGSGVVVSLELPLSLELLSLISHFSFIFGV